MAGRGVVGGGVSHGLGRIFIVRLEQQSVVVRHHARQLICVEADGILCAVSAQRFGGASPRCGRAVIRARRSTARRASPRCRAYLVEPARASLGHTAVAGQYSVQRAVGHSGGAAREECEIERATGDG